MLTPLEPLTNPTRLSDVVFDRITSAIVGGALPPGTPIKDAELARQLGVSRMPVREALQRLSRAGLVEVAASRFTRVTRVTPELVRHTLDFARCYSATVVALTVPRLSVRETREVSRTIRDAIAAIDAGRPAHLSTRPVYRRLAAMSGNRFLTEMLADIDIAVERNLAHAEQDERATAQVRAALIELRTAIERGAAPAAVQAVMRQYGVEESGTGPAEHDAPAVATP